MGMLNLSPEVWERAGCHCIRMQAAVHDSTVARISHIHALSALCVHSALDGGDVELLGLVSAGGFRDTTRVPWGNRPVMSGDSGRRNSPAVLERLDAALAQLNGVRKFFGGQGQEVPGGMAEKSRQEQGAGSGAVGFPEFFRV